MAKKGINKALAKLIEGKTDPMEIAAITADYINQINIENERKRFVEGIICEKKLTLQQMDALVWEYAMHEAGCGFESWIKREHPELVGVGKAAAEVPVGVGDDSASVGG